MFDLIIQDIRYAARTLRRSPGFSAVAIVTLALGIGANTTIFSVVQKVLLRTLPYREPGRLVEIWNNYYPQWPQLGLSPANFEEWRQEVKSVTDMAAYQFVPTDLNLTGEGESERVEATFATAELFTMLGVKPVLGRAFIPSEDKTGAPNIALISHQLWETRFGGDPAVVGRTITLDGKDYTLAGVLPGNFRLAPWADIWFPTGLMDADELKTRLHHPFGVVARLAPNATIAQAQAEMTTLARQEALAHPATDTNWGVAVAQLKDPAAVKLRAALFVLSGAVGLVLLIACANLVNLLFARNADRQRQIALRIALGANRARLMAQLLTETMLWALAGGGLGILIADTSLEGLKALAPAELSSSGPAGLNGWVLGFTLGVSVLTGIFCGVLPAFQSAGADLNTVMKGSATGRGGAATGKLRNAFVVAEIALSLILLAGAGLFLRGFGNLLRVDPGFRAENILTMRVSQRAIPLDVINKMTPAQSQKLQVKDSWRFQQLAEQIAALPGVKSVGGIDILPIAESQRATSRFAIEGQTDTEKAPRPTAQIRTADAGYFATMGIALIEGRLLNESDWTNPNVVISRSMAQRFWPQGDAIGHRINFCWMDAQPCWSPVVGIVGDVHQYGLNTGPTFDVYSAGGWTESLVIRADRDPSSLVAAVRDKIRGFDSGLAVSHVATMEQLLSDSVAQQRFTTLLLAMFAALALLLAAVGIYGVVSYGVSRRTREIGIRMALGAQPGDVSRLIVWQGLVLAVAGAAIGLMGALVLSRLIGSLLFEVKPTDPLTFIAVTILLIGAALVACYVPGRRAMRVDPIVALRYE
ncbi:MAG TPA: ABC transporter permease [Candidatus Acidoferrales bacterium]